MKNRKGFTLVEIMIVVAIIALLAAIAIPNLLRARIQASEAAAATAMHTLSAAEQSWRAASATYASLANLISVTPPYIDATLGSGTKQGYLFTATPGAGALAATEFVACGMPIVANSHSYYLDEDGVLCRSTAATGPACPAHMDACSVTFPEVS